MLKQIGLKEAVGKTIAAIDSVCADAIFVFADGTFLWIEAETYYDSTNLSTDNPLKIGDCYERHIKLGIITREELGAYKLAEHDRIEAYRVERERAEYARLQAKYGSKS